MTALRAASGLWVLWLAGLAAHAEAAPVRDPMQPPARRAAAVVPSTGAAAAAVPAPLPVVRQIVVVGEDRFAVDQGRRRRVGDLWGGLRIERIDESGLVVRDGSALRRLPLHAGVGKRAAAHAPDEAPDAATDARPDRAWADAPRRAQPAPAPAPASASASEPVPTTRPSR